MSDKYLSREEKYRAILDEYRRHRGLRFVPRAGSDIYGCFSLRIFPTKIAKYERITVSEHTELVETLMNSFLDYFPESFPMTYEEKYLVYRILHDHEIAEPVIGDIPDDGNRDEEKKDAAELELFKEHVKNLPEKYQARVIKLFQIFQGKFFGDSEAEEKRTYDLFYEFPYTIDKLAALLEALDYEECGHVGHIAFKRERIGASNRDEEAAKAVGDGRQVDVWSVPFVRLMKSFRFGWIFIEFLEFAISDVRKRPYHFPPNL